MREDRRISILRLLDWGLGTGDWVAGWCRECKGQQIGEVRRGDVWCGVCRDGSYGLPIWSIPKGCTQSPTCGSTVLRA